MEVSIDSEKPFKNVIFDLLELCDKNNTANANINITMPGGVLNMDITFSIEGEDNETNLS